MCASSCYIILSMHSIVGRFTLGCQLPLVSRISSSYDLFQKRMIFFANNLDKEESQGNRPRDRPETRSRKIMHIFFMNIHELVMILCSIIAISA